VLPEVDYLAQNYLGSRVEAAFLEDVAQARYTVEWGEDADRARAGFRATSSEERRARNERTGLLLLSSENRLFPE
jgi:hypothetical protein